MWLFWCVSIKCVDDINWFLPDSGKLTVNLPYCNKNYYAVRNARSAHSRNPLKLSYILWINKQDVSWTAAHRYKPHDQPFYLSDILSGIKISVSPSLSQLMNLSLSKPAGTISSLLQVLSLLTRININN